MKVLLTGIGGFIGSHALDYFLKTTDWKIIGIDSFANKGTYTRIEDTRRDYMHWYDPSRLKIFKHDLTSPIDRQLENQILEKSIDSFGVINENPIDIIINLASDSAVERSATNPTHCLKNNYDLMINVLEFARKNKPKIFFQCSTDEVYGDAPPGVFHKEWSPIVPNNPYSASKAAQEAIAISYWRTFDVPVVITNTVNNFGEKQDCEKFLPTIINTIFSGKSVPIYADSPDKIGSRFYLHAKNHADAFLFLSKFKPSTYQDGTELPDRYNITSEDELNNLEMAQLVAQIMGKDLKYHFVSAEIARKGYDRRYALDGTKMREKGWKPPFLLQKGLENVVDWTLKNQHWLF